MEQLDPEPYAYTGADQDITITPFTIFPTDCDITYEIVDVTLDGATPADSRPIPLSEFEYDHDNKKWVVNFDKSKYTDPTNPYPPGDYTITIKGPATEAITTGNEGDVDITFTIPDVCDPPDVSAWAIIA